MNTFGEDLKNFLEKHPYKTADIDGVKYSYIKGTEDMKEYKDFLFHIGQSCIGMLLGLPVCAAVGALVMFFKFG